MDQDIAIVGVGDVDFGALYRTRDVQRSSYDLAADAFRAALDESGVRKQDVDAVLCMRIPSYVQFCSQVGLRHVRHANYYEGDGRMSGLMIQHAAALIRAGLATTVACVYGNDGRSVQEKYGGTLRLNTPSAYDQMFGLTSPGAYVALMYERYRHLYSVAEGALAPLAINNRDNALLNPRAVMRTPLSRDEYMASRFIAEPLRIYDYCLINDGAAAAIVTTADRARDLKKKPVFVRGMSGSTDMTNFYSSDDFFFEGCRAAAQDLHRTSGFSPKDMDSLQIYDNFTPTILFTLEGFGYAPRGESSEWIRDRIGLNDELPMNTSGGHTSESYMQGWGHQVEAVRQLRGECGDRQLKKCDVVHYMCVSPLIVSNIYTNQ